MPKKAWPPNTRLNRGYIEFRKQYRGESIFRQWPSSQQEEAFSEIYKILGRIERHEDFSAGGERSLPVPEVCDLFWNLYASKTGYKAYPSMLERIKAHFAGRFFDTLDDDDVGGLLRWLRTTKFQHERWPNKAPYHLSINSINKHHECLRSIFKQVRKFVDLGKIPPIRLPKQLNPATLIPKDSANETVRRRVLSYEEVERLHSRAHESVKRIIEADLFTLLRKGDLKSLRDWLQDDRLTGVQGKTQQRIEIPTNDLWKFADLDWTNFRRRLAAAVKAAHIKDFQFRDLRRTGATWLFRKTNDLGLVQLRLGHKSPEMTKRYLGIMDDDSVRASQVLGSIIAGFGEKVGENSQNSAEGSERNESRNRRITGSVAQW